MTIDVFVMCSVYWLCVRCDFLFFIIILFLKLIYLIYDVVSNKEEWSVDYVVVSPRRQS
mgnify:CR=1 FL=1